MYLIEPANPPAAVSLNEAKAHCRIDGADHDATLARLIVSATDDAEGATGRALVTRSLTLCLEWFAPVIPLQKPPVASVTAIKYRNSQGQEVTVPDSVYRLVPDDLRPVVRLNPGKSWPVDLMAGYGDGAVSIEYQAGYGDTDAVPAPVKSWIFLRIGDELENIGTAIAGHVSHVPWVDSLLGKYKVYP